MNPNSKKISIIILIAIILRIGVALYLGDAITGEQQKRIQDQVSYNALARSLIEGKGYTFDKDWYPGFTKANEPTAHWSFLYPLYLAFVYAITGYHPLIARIIQAILAGGLSIWLVYRLSQRLFNESIGIISAGLTAIYLYFIFYDAALMTEAFFTTGILAILNTSLVIIDKFNEEGHQNGVFSPGIWFWLVLGFIVGITSLLRQTILLFLPFLLIWIFIIRQKKKLILGPLILMIPVVFIILPWTIRNYVVYQSFLPLNSNAGYAFYSANHPYHKTHFDQDYGVPLPSDLASQGLNEAQWNTALTIRGMKYMLEDPLRIFLLSLNRAGVFFNFGFSPESDLPSNLMRLLSFGLYLPFYLFGLILSFRNWKRYSLIYLFVVVFSLLHILTWASIRYRLPIDATMMPFAGLAIYCLWKRKYPIKGDLISTKLLNE